MEQEKRAQSGRAYDDFAEAFWQLYEKKDINKIKVKEICDLAGYHRTTFYHHFTDVYDVLEHIEDKIIDEISENSDKSLVTGKSSDSAKSFAAIYEKYKRYLKLLADESKGSRFAYKMNRALKPKYREIVTFSSDAAKNECILEYHMSGSIAVIMQYFRGESKLGIEEIINITIELGKQEKWPMTSM